MVYLGAIRGLEKKISPGKRNPLFDHRADPNTRQFKGVSGASAGAITAYMLALGMTADEIGDEANTAFTYRLGIGETTPVSINAFERFFEPVAKKMVKPIINQFNHVKKDRAGDDYYDNDTAANYKKLLVKSIAEPLITTLLKPLFGIDTKALEEDHFIVQKVLGDDESDFVRKELAGYLYGLIYNRGLFPGMAVRFYFEDLMKRFVINKLSWEERKRVGIGFGRTPLPADLTFRQFFDITGVDLVITGTNLSTNQSKYFSVGYTPEFPVIDAVGLSMAIPLIFKPVCSTRPYVHYEETDDYNKAYTGLWADGGILNNLPIHAFDHVETKQLSYKGNINAFEVSRPSFEPLVPFCDCVLGFTLASTRNAEFDFDREFRTTNPSVLGELITSKIYPTLVYPANSGQIRTIEEQASTIDLNTGTISVLDFAGPAIDAMNGRKTRSLEKEVLIREAEALVRQRTN